ncbi:MAG TPA: DNA polymerase III subunit alpha [Anseongella sp.]
MPEFSHLHVHTQYSLLDGAAAIKGLFQKAENDNMRAVAITDHGNMFGVFNFVAQAAKFNVKPIVGCEFYMVEDRHRKSFTKESGDNRHHQLLLAKDAEGYKNLSKLCSLGYIEGLYSKWPRIDKELLLQYHKGLIATTCCIGAEVPQAILNKGEDEAEKLFKWWLDLFGEDYYVEIQRHKMEEQEQVNAALLRFAKKYNVKIIASNDSHYIDQEDADAHDILLCVNTGELKSTPIGDGKGYRFGFPNNEFYFKTQAEMNQVFSDLPQAIDNTNEIVDKIEPLKLKRDILLPDFPIPPGYQDIDEYLRHLTYEGAEKRYGEISTDVRERLDFELFTIKSMGFAGYFLIVSDFIRAGRDLGVMVGPGRGSAAGSAVAYCIGITNIDPVKYNLLFERFLNPERMSMPDIDTDFDDEGRQKVIEYVVDKYGRNQVAQIITYGSMAAKMSIKDVARTLELPLADSNYLTKLVPDKPGTSLRHVFDMDLDTLKQKGYNSDDIGNIQKLRKIIEGNDLQSKILKEARLLEGSVRNTGIHAAGVIIAPNDITDCIPTTTSKDSDLLVTQFDGKVIEDAGLLKMDFLGLKTLTIIKDALRMIKANHGRDIDPDELPLDDEKTFELFQRGETNGVFQFESSGMQKYLKELRPDKFDDLIAMNALYRPGPLEYIPKFIKRKQGLEEVVFDLPEMEEYLADTYGITVYQEQVMLLSQKLAGFSKGEADTLRKAMGKKLKDVLDKMKSRFTEGCKERGHDPKVCDKIWTDWEAFASYAFNKSHSTCYAFVAYQTAYLKAHYPSEFMAAVLNAQNNIEDISFFMDECRRLGIPVLGPDVNESDFKFTVNKKGEVRFGMGGIKGVGSKAVENIIEERGENGPYQTVFEFSSRVNPRMVNKKAYECLVYSGAFDCFGGYHRAQYFGAVGDKFNGIERLIKYSNDYQANLLSNQHSLFGGTSEANIAEPGLPDCDPWPLLEKLRLEKEVIGMYLSGHPLDDFRLELKSFCGITINQLTDEHLPALKGRQFSFAGIITNVYIGMDKRGRNFGRFMVEDYKGSLKLLLFAEDYLKFKHFLAEGTPVYITARVEERFRNAELLEIRINQMQLLSEVKDKMTRSVTLSVSLNDIAAPFISRIEELVKEHPGKCGLKISINDPLENIGVDMPSKTYKVAISEEFLSGLGQIEKVVYRLN